MGTRCSYISTRLKSTYFTYKLNSFNLAVRKFTICISLSLSLYSKSPPLVSIRVALIREHIPTTAPDGHNPVPIDTRWVMSTCRSHLLAVITHQPDFVELRQIGCMGRNDVGCEKMDAFLPSLFGVGEGGSGGWLAASCIHD